MLASKISHILYVIEQKEELRRKVRRRRKKLTPKQKREEKAERKRIRRAIQTFVDDEAEESDCDAESDTPGEAGLDTAFLKEEFRDSRGRHYVLPRGKTGKLFRITSRDYYSHNRAKRRLILARSLRCSKINATLPNS